MFRKFPVLAQASRAASGGAAGAGAGIMGGGGGMGGGAGGGGGASSSQQQRQQREFKDQMTERMKNNPHGELGLSKEEFEARKIRAAEGYKVKKGQKDISVHSSARSQQIMNQGSVERLHDMKTAEMKLRDRQWWWFSVSVATVGMCVTFLIMQVYLVPILKLRNDRYLMQKRRHEEIFLPALAKLEEAKKRQAEEAAAAGGNAATATATATGAAASSK